MTRREEEARALQEARKLREEADAERVKAVRRMVEEEELSLSEITERMGIGRNVVRRLLKLANLQPKPKRCQLARGGPL